jgi:hypothetical protein
MMQTATNAASPTTVAIRRRTAPERQSSRGSA